MKKVYWYRSLPMGTFLRKGKFRRILLSILLIFIVLVSQGRLWPAQPVLAALNCNENSWSVNSETDLNAAIDCFNNKPAGSYTITLAQSINLTASSTTIDSTTGATLTLDGAGFTVDGQNGNGVRPIYINSSTVTIQNITIAGGNPGATGGGILNTGTLTVIDSTIRDNTATSGGGIYTWIGTLSVMNSTLNNNSATNLGGGIYNDHSLTLTNSTVSGNQAAAKGGGLYNWGTMSIESSTISNNAGVGGGIYNDAHGTLTLSNSIIADSPSGDDCISDGAVVIDHPNLVESGTCVFSPDPDPKLGPLQDNGGPTFTQALLPGSPALNTGASYEATDQRGVGRPHYGRDDIGAYELYDCAGWPWPAYNLVQLNQAIACFNSRTDPLDYRIDVGGNISLSASPGSLNNPTPGVSLTIEGHGFTLDGQGIMGVRPVDIINGIVTIQNLTISGGHQPVNDYGGAIFNREGGNLTLLNSTISSNQAFTGGGIENWGTLTITLSTISSNIATSFGGGIDNADNAVAVISQSVIRGNKAASGAGIMNWFDSALPSLTIEDSTVSTNTASEKGGGIANLNALVNIDNSTISGNQAYDGGGIMNWFDSSVPTMTVHSSTISDNSALNMGGGINNLGGKLTLSNSIIANSAGGGDCVSTVTVADGGHNLIEDSSAANCGFVNHMNGNLVGSDPMLGALEDNGGPTFTHALLPGSPAIDAGSGTDTTDQRGVSRPQAFAVDIGAFELEWTPSQLYLPMILR